MIFFLKSSPPIIFRIGFPVRIPHRRPCRIRQIQTRFNPEKSPYPLDGIICYISPAGWSSLVAREAHNLEVVGSNPTPATENPPQRML